MTNPLCNAKVSIKTSLVIVLVFTVAVSLLWYGLLQDDWEGTAESVGGLALGVFWFFGLVIPLLDDVNEDNLS